MCALLLAVLLAVPYARGTLLLPHLEPGQEYCIIDDIPFSHVIDSLRVYYETHPNVERPLEEKSIWDTIRFVFYTATRFDRFVMVERDADADGDPDPCFFFMNKTSAQYVPLAAPRTTEDLVLLADVLGLHTPLEIYRASQSDAAGDAYCADPSPRSTRGTLVRMAWCFFRVFYAPPEDAGDVQRRIATDAPPLHPRAAQIFRDGMRDTVIAAYALPERIPTTLTEKWGRLQSSSSRLWGALPTNHESAATILERLRVGYDVLVPHLEDLRNINAGPYIDEAWKHVREHERKGGTHNTSDFFINALRETEQQKALARRNPGTRHAFFITGVPKYEGMAPGQWHVWNLEHWPSTGVILQHAINWLFHLWSCDRTLCEPCLPFLADSISGCVWPILDLHPDSIVTRWFPGFDPLNAGCDAYDETGAYFLGVWNALFTTGNPPNLVPCLIWNLYIPLFWIFVGVLAVVLIGISAAVFYCCWRCQDNLTNRGGDREQDLRRLIRQQRRVRALERREKEHRQQILAAGQTIVRLTERVQVLERSERGLTATETDAVDIVESVFGQENDDSWVQRVHTRGAGIEGSSASSEKWMS